MKIAKRNVPVHIQSLFNWLSVLQLLQAQPDLQNKASFSWTRHACLICSSRCSEGNKVNSNTNCEKAILWFEEDNFLLSTLAFLNDLTVVVFVAARTCKLRRPQEQVNTSITRAIRTLGRKLDCSVAGLLWITTHRHHGRSAVTTSRREPASCKFYNAL